MMRKVSSIAVTALLLTGSIAARGEEPTNPAASVLKAHIMLTAEEMRWQACPPSLPPGATCVTIEGDRNAPDVLFTYRIKMPDNYRITPHFHPADEHVTVISGTFNMGLGDK